MIKKILIYRGKNIMIKNKIYKGLVSINSNSFVNADKYLDKKLLEEAYGDLNCVECLFLNVSNTSLKYLNNIADIFPNISGLSILNENREGVFLDLTGIKRLNNLKMFNYEGDEISKILNLEESFKISTLVGLSISAKDYYTDELDLSGLPSLSHLSLNGFLKLDFNKIKMPKNLLNTLVLENISAANIQDFISMQLNLETLSLCNIVFLDTKEISFHSNLKLSNLTLRNLPVCEKVTSVSRFLYFLQVINCTELKELNFTDRNLSSTPKEVELPCIRNIALGNINLDNLSINNGRAISVYRAVECHAPELWIEQKTISIRTLARLFPFNDLVITELENPEVSCSYRTSFLIQEKDKGV